MLGDRGYMNRAAETPESGRRMLMILIGINVAAFLLVQSPQLKAVLALSVPGLQRGYYFELVTAMFMHGGFGHIFFNMWALYVFGSIVAPILGKTRFLILYFISGIVGNLLWLAANWGSPALLVGASGAIFGVMLAVAMLTPNVRFMLLFFPVPIKASTLVIVFAVIEIVSELQAGGNIAHLAHLGGFLGAYVYLKIIFGNRLPWDVFGFLRHKSRPGEDEPGPQVWRTGNTPVSQRELDMLLDKISRQGINSLTPQEMDRLRKAREEMRR